MTDRLKAQRGGHRGVATRISKEISEILELNDSTPGSITRLETLQKSLTERLETLLRLDTEILELLETSDIETDILEASDVELRLKQILHNLHKFIQDANSTPASSHVEIVVPPPSSNPPLAQPSTESPDASGSTSNSLLQVNLSTYSTTKVRLPKLDLPKFKGEIVNFTSFWDIYESTIHTNRALSPIDKYNYLKSYLEGEAARAIQGLPLTDANYEVAVTILKQRYGNKQQVISAHMDELLNIPACGDKVHQLKFVYDKINVHVRGLEALGVDSEKYGSLLIPIIMARLPKEISLRVARLTSSEVWMINDVLEIIRREVEAREISENIKIKELKAAPTNENVLKKNKFPPTASALHTQSKLNCVYCNSDHYSAACDQIKDVDARRQILKRDGRCFLCLAKNHRVCDCKRNKNCRSCGRKHHQSICFPREKSSTPNSQNTHQSGSPTETQVGEVVTTTSIAKSRISIILQTARALVRGKDSGKTVSARILFDNGSQRSYITKALSDKLNIRGKSEILHLNTFGGNTHRRQQCDAVELLLRKNGGEEIAVHALTFPTICSKLPMSVEVHRYPHLQSLQLADDFESENNGTIDILIGSDYYWDFVTGNVVKGETGPVAVESKLGWILSGTADNCDTGVDARDGESAVNLILQSEIGTLETQDNLKNILSDFWQTESIGICDLDNNNVADNPVKEEFLNEINHDGTRYNVKLPWKTSMEVLPDHYNLSETRTKYLLQRLRRNEGMLSKYNNMIQDQLKSGIIEPVDKDENNNNKRIHYMPHHGVVREDKTTTKLRIVYDGSASDNSNISLNSCLNQGPNLIPSIFNILLRFRVHHIGLIADIEKAFLMVGIHPDDRDALRFLWFKNVEERNPEMVAYRFCRLVFGLRPSPAILGTTIQHHLSLYEHEEPEIVKELQDSLYVDDLTSGAGTEKDAFNLYLSAKNIMVKGGFNLRKWTSNSKEVCRMIAENELKNNIELNIAESENNNLCITEDDTSYAKDALNSFSTSTEKVVKILGVNWNVLTDMLLFEMDELLKLAASLPRTKRSVLQFSARIFDPLGLISAFTINAKVLFQRLCTDKRGWDEELSEEMKHTWESLINQLQHLNNNVQVPRCYFTSTNNREIELHGFSDASGKAYAAMIYMRTIYDDHIETALLCCKARVAPLKSQTIPRLELLGALILARLLNTVVNALNESVTIKNTYCWTDSTTVLCWIRNDKPWKRYVSNRVVEIRELTSVSSWRHISGNSNPADLPSRGITAYQLVNSQLWWTGPKFLKQDDSDWPAPPCENLVDDAALEEVVVNPKVSDTTRVLVTVQEEKLLPNIGNIMKCETFSNITRLLRVTAYVLRFAYNLKCKVNKSTIITDQLSADEIETARIHWIKSAQADSFRNELVAVRNNDLSANLPYIKQFGLFMDEMGVLRCKGRLDNSSLPYHTRNPVFLPGKHHLTLLIINKVHTKVMHSGIRNTLTVVRENYWIPRGREVVKRLIRHCIVCTKYAGKTYPMQEPPNLPSGRVDEGPPWSNTGVDYAGPLYIHRNLSTSEKISEKVYVCLFTCASTRAVHLELVEGCSAEVFLRAFRRFTCRRGVPRQLFSDNAKNFKSACKDIEKIRRSEDVQGYMANAGVNWTFIAEKAPWWGGFWERLIKSVKTCLKKSVGRVSLSFDELHTLLIEVEGCLNARPLTYIYDDSEGVSYPLSPSHLIYGRKLTKSPNSEHYEIVSTNESLTKRVKYHRRLLSQFTKQWSKEYLTSLREHANVVSNALNTPTITVGDIVFLKDKGTAKCFWKLARVVELLPGKDNSVRAAKIRIMNNDPNRKPSILTRPIQLLIPTEVKSTQENAGVNPPVVLNPNAEPFVPRLRPQRQAAIVGERLRREQKMT